jgi:malate synthase
MHAYENGRFTEAVEIFDGLILNDEFVEFLTVPGYKLL